ncbi:MAG: RNA-binding S4 domain-containing protein [Gammaproteobacteria bacterium]|nr:MAG: RNA-binding S4 domain-containing protein [Gammaproteobacteria bacterium]
MNTETPRIRLDKWLWAARFFKTRRLATEAITGGHVHLDGRRVKPSRPVRVGDRLEIRKGALHFEIEVLALSDRRGPASEAAGLYRELPESIARRERARAASRLAAAAPAPDRRPDKRARRRLRRIKGVPE